MAALQLATPMLKLQMFVVLQVIAVFIKLKCAIRQEALKTLAYKYAWIPRQYSSYVLMSEVDLVRMRS